MLRNVNHKALLNSQQVADLGHPKSQYQYHVEFSSALDSDHATSYRYSFLAVVGQPKDRAFEDLGRTVIE